MFDLLDGGGFGLWMKEACNKASLLGGMIGASLAGSWALKWAADTGQGLYFAGGLAAWAVSGGFFVEILKSGGSLGLWGITASCLQMTILMLISTTFLGEHYTPQQWLLASTAIIFMGLSMAMGVRHG